MQTAYQELEAIFRKVLVLRSVSSLLRWDAEVMMPKNSHHLRAEQLTTLHTLTQELVLSGQVARFLKKAAQEKDQLDSWQQINLSLMERQYTHLSALPHRLVEKINHAIRNAEHAWFAAREEGNFRLFEPALQKLVGLHQEKGQRLAERLQVTPFEALIDEHDPQRTQAEIDRLLKQIKPYFPQIIYAAAQQVESPLAITGKYPKRKQFALCRELLRLLHFPMKQGRLDESVHPFTEGIAEDIRITTIFDRHNPLHTLLGLIHELGHALYDNALPRSYRFQLVGQDAGMVIHEGMALFWEKIIASLPEFTEWLAIHLQAHFGHLPCWSADNIYHLLLQIDPHRPRMEADEIGYMGHIMIRYEIEKALFCENMRVKDIPGLWQEKMKTLLGIDLIDPTQDCLQDIHWAHGYFGYFHTYALGFFFAAQLFTSLKQHHSHVFAPIRAGNFLPLLGWLQEHLFQWGAHFNSNQLIIHLTGQPFHGQPYIDYLCQKYQITLNH